MSYQLSIKFAGVCTHFRFGVVAGVPHRVVLPDAAMVMTGRADHRESGGSPSRSAVLLPAAALSPDRRRRDGFDPEKLYVPALVNDGGPAMKNGDILSGIRLQVINAVETGMIYETDHTPRLTDYDPQYTLSGDVAHQGRAACYFDFNVGTVRSHQAQYGAMQTIVTVTTEAAPQILVTPLASSNAPTRSYFLPLPSHSDNIVMTVSNLELAQEEPTSSDVGAFDFLLNYLTAHGGIPQVIQEARARHGLRDTPLRDAGRVRARSAQARNAGPPPKRETRIDFAGPGHAIVLGFAVSVNYSEPPDWFGVRQRSSREVRQIQRRVELPLFIDAASSCVPTRGSSELERLVVMDTGNRRNSA